MGTTKETKRLADNFGDKKLKMKAICKILKQMNAGKNIDDWKKINLKKTIRMANFINTLTELFEVDHQMCIIIFTSASGSSVDNIFSFYKGPWHLKKGIIGSGNTGNMT